MSTTALLATADATLLDDLLRLAAAADTRVVVARTVSEARTAWAKAALVVIGSDLAVELAREGPPPRRSGVLLLAGREEGDEVYRLAVELGAHDIVRLAEAEQRLMEALAAAGEPPAGRAATVAVMGGRGGAGASVLAAMLGVTAMRDGIGTLLVDGDPLGGGLDLLLGQERRPGARWPELADRRGRLSGTALTDRLPQVPGGGLHLLSWHREPSGLVSPPAIGAVLAAARRGFDLVIADVPRDPGPSAAVQTLLTAADLLLLIVPTELRAVVAARQVAATVLPYIDDVRVVVRRIPPGEIGPAAVAEAVDLPLAGVMCCDRRVPGALDRGDLLRLAGRGPLGRLCAELVSGPIHDLRAGAGGPWRMSGLPT